MHSCTLIGAPLQCGASQAGCLMGPDAYRTAGLSDVLHSLGHSVEDLGDVKPRTINVARHSNSNIHDMAETVGWAIALEEQAYKSSQSGSLPIFLGGDHSLSIGTVPGVARHWKEKGRPLFVLWLDAHPDIHSLETTDSGNLHGTPVAYFTGRDGFSNHYPPLAAAVELTNVCMMGIRSVDEAEHEVLTNGAISVHDMRAIDENGVAAPLQQFLERVKTENGALHVSLDVDFLDPAVAPAVGTTVPGGATFREAHLIMEMLCDSRLVTSVDLVELNPFLDERGKTAKLMVDLCASLFGRKVLDRKTRSY